MHDKHFQNAIAKLQAPGHLDVNLSIAEKEAVKIFKVTAAEEDEAKVDIALALARSVSFTCTRYEQQQQSRELTMIDNRKCMDPSTLEMVTA